MTTVIANVEMAQAWDGEEGAEWARDWERYDRAVRGYQLQLLEAAAITTGDHVLDVGCGNGESTRAAARAAGDGTALGVELSSLMIERARELARREALANATFERADAQVHPFVAATYDVVLSRFGTMFFADPAAAFDNIGRAMQSGRWLVLVSWQTLDRNEWLQEIRSALAVGRDLPAPPVGAPGPFGQADPDAVAATLSAAGFDQVGFESLDEPFWAGADAEDAFRFISNVGVARGLLQDLDAADRTRALNALRATMVAHDTGDGVLFGSAAWLISARRATP